MNQIVIKVFPTILLSKNINFAGSLVKKVLNFDLGSVVMTVFEPITS